VPCRVDVELVDAVVVEDEHRDPSAAATHVGLAGDVPASQSRTWSSVWASGNAYVARNAAR
jgi:hypothetical protein